MLMGTAVLELNAIHPLVDFKGPLTKPVERIAQQRLAWRETDRGDWIVVSAEPANLSRGHREAVESPSQQNSMTAAWLLSRRWKAAPKARLCHSLHALVHWA